MMSEITNSTEFCSKRLGFIHIPKTAGTSIREAISRFGETYVPNDWDYQQFMETLTSIPVLSGHYPFWRFRLEPISRTLFTVLRDPTERVLSFYRYIIAQPSHYAHRYVVGNQLSLCDCFKNQALRIELCNLQTRMLGWSPDRQLTVPCTRQSHYRDFAATNVDYLFSDIDRNTLDSAISRLDNEVDFAIRERPNSLSAMIGRLTGTIAPTIPYSNVGQVEYKATEQELELIRENNLLDQELYDIAVVNSQDQ